MPKVIANVPKPIEPPPTTFNVELSSDEFLALRSLVSRRQPMSDRVLEPLRLQMWAVSRKLESPFKIIPATNSTSAYRIRRKFSYELGDKDFD